MSRVLLTGCSSMLGAHAVAALREAGHEVIATGPTATDQRRALDVLDERAFAESARGASLIVHLAAVRLHGEGALERCRAVNVGGVRNALSAALRSDAAVVFVGSGEEYGAEPGPWTEQTECAPLSPYGVSKHEATKTIFTAANVRSIVLRPSTVYGPGQRRAMLVAEAIHAGLSDTTLAISGGTQTRDHVYVADVAEAIVRAAAVVRDVPAATVINVASGASHTVEHVARRALFHAGGGTLRVGPAPTRAGDVQRAEYRIERAMELLRWAPTTSLDEGLAKTAETERAMRAR